MFTIMGAIHRGGAWRVPNRLRVFAVMGGIDLDFRDAEFAPGLTTVHITCVMGGVAVAVPPALAVSCEGSGVLGLSEAFEQKGDPANPDAPRLRITGTAIMGGVEIAVRSPGGPMKTDPKAHPGQWGDRRESATPERSG